MSEREDDLLALCESPIEQDLCFELLAMGSGIDVLPQFKLGRFRYDFLIRKNGKDRPAVLIECDGKDFHSNPQQIANDKQKDEAAREAGMGIVRFSGSEIWNDPRNCAAIALDALYRLHLLKIAGKK